MKVEVKYFALLREAAGKDAETVERAIDKAKAAGTATRGRALVEIARSYLGEKAGE